MTSGLPLTVRWELDGIVFNGPPDQAGREWVVTSDHGWSGSAPPRPNRSARLWQDGSTRGRPFRNERIIRLDGYVACPTWEARREAEHRLAALCAGPALYPLVCHEETGSWVSWVELDDAVMVAIAPGGYDLDFSIQVAAPDPNRYSYTERSVSAGLVADAAPSTRYSMRVTFRPGGNARAPLLIELAGPIDAYPSLSLYDESDDGFSSSSIFYRNPTPIPAGTSLFIDTGRRTAYLTGGYDRRSFLVDPDWRLARPGLLNTVVLGGQAAFNAQTRLTVRWRDTRH